jgi:hypothetical protein
MIRRFGTAACCLPRASTMRRSSRSPLFERAGSVLHCLGPRFITAPRANQCGPNCSEEPSRCETRVRKTNHSFDTCHSTTTRKTVCASRGWVQGKRVGKKRTFGSEPAAARLRALEESGGFRAYEIPVEEARAKNAMAPYGKKAAPWIEPSDAAYGAS